MRVHLSLSCPGYACDIQLVSHLLAAQSTVETIYTVNSNWVHPVPCRDDLASLAQSHFYKTGNAAEIGVFTGEFSKKNLNHWQGNYLMIDAWRYR